MNKRLSAATGFHLPDRRVGVRFRALMSSHLTWWTHPRTPATPAECTFRFCGEPHLLPAHHVLYPSNESAVFRLCVLPQFLMTLICTIAAPRRSLPRVPKHQSKASSPIRNHSRKNDSYDRRPVASFFASQALSRVSPRVGRFLAVASRCRNLIG